MDLRILDLDQILQTYDKWVEEVIDVYQKFSSILNDQPKTKLKKQISENTVTKSSNVAPPMTNCHFNDSLIETSAHDLFSSFSIEKYRHVPNRHPTSFEPVDENVLTSKSSKDRVPVEATDERVLPFTLPFSPVQVEDVVSSDLPESSMHVDSTTVLSFDLSNNDDFCASTPNRDSHDEDVDELKTPESVSLTSIGKSNCRVRITPVRLPIEGTIDPSHGLENLQGKVVNVDMNTSSAWESRPSGNLKMTLRKRRRVSLSASVISEGGVQNSNNIDEPYSLPTSSNAQSLATDELPADDADDAEDEFVCNGCGKIFRHKKHLRIHVSRNFLSRDLQFKCDVRSKTSMKCDRKNKKSESKNKNQCTVCHRTFKWRSSLQCHLRIHNGERPFECAICGKRFTLKGDLPRHLRTHSREKPFACTKCDKRFTRESYLKEHQRTHTGERPPVCTNCDKVFTRKRDKKFHQTTHNSERLFACTTCGKKFNRKGNLLSHQRTHNSEKPFACTICGKRFTRKGNLQCHQRTHNDVKPFACTTCGKRFTQNVNLQCHQRTHNGEKAFACTTCGKRFTSKQNLKRHQRTHNPGN